MEKLTRVALDAMGGDHAPGEVIKGAVDAVNACQRVKVYLVGQEKRVTEELAKYQYDKDRIEVVHAEEVIETAEPPVLAIRNKKDSSLVKALLMVKNNEADAFVSAGSTGATLVGGQVLIGRIQGIARAPLAPVLPTERGPVLLIDCGANVDARASQLVQFAKIGSIYMENVMHRKDPKVALVNIGAEEEKGNALVKEAYPLLKNCPDIHFAGNIEARDIPAGGLGKEGVDVIVCEAFVGNVILKMYEGTARSLMHVIKDALMGSVRGKIGGFLIKPVLKGVLSKYDAEQYGGAPMLGLKGLVVKAHGSSHAGEIKQAILQCVDFHEQNVNEQIRSKIVEDPIQPKIVEETMQGKTEQGEV